MMDHPGDQFFGMYARLLVELDHDVDLGQIDRLLTSFLPLLDGDTERAGNPK